MAITKSDIKLVASQRMTDNPDGGGRITGNEIVDGASNGIFDDVTDLDRVTGSVGLRKVFPFIDTDNVDVYMGGNVIVAEEPSDPAVSISLFSTGDYDDVRSGARDMIERYLVKSSQSKYDLLGNHFEGQRSLSLFALRQYEPPVAGDVVVVESADGSAQQYCRIVEVDSALEVFTYIFNNTVVDFEAWRISAEITAPLEHDFIGGDPTETGTQMPSGSVLEKSLVYQTEVADAARYYSIKDLDTEASIGDVTVSVPSLFTSIVPSAQGETPLVDLPMAPLRDSNYEASSSNISDSLYFEISAANPVMYTRRPVMPGTLQLSSSGTVVADDSRGNLYVVSGGSQLGAGTIDYRTGTIRVSNPSIGGGYRFVTATYRPALFYTGSVVSDFSEVTIATRGFNWTKYFPAMKPRPGTTQVSYRVLGQWYTLEDDGSGNMVGYGSGSVNFTTGTIAITTQELPDVDSQILFQFVPNDDDEVATIDGSVTKSAHYVLQGPEAIEPGTLALSFTGANNGQAQTVSDDGYGNLTGDGSGTVDYLSGEIVLFPDQMAQSTITIGVDANNVGEISTESITGLSTSSQSTAYQISGTLGNTDVTPGSVAFKVHLRSASRYHEPSGSFSGLTSGYDYIEDDGAGGFTRRGFTTGGDKVAIVGTIDYATGDYSLKHRPSVSYQSPVYVQISGSVGGLGANIEPQTVTKSVAYALQTGTVSITYRHAGTPASAPATPIVTTPTELHFRLTTGEAVNPIIPGTLLFDYRDTEYYDRDGIVYTGFDPENGSGTAVGSIDYDSHRLTLTTFVASPILPAATVLSGITANATGAVDSMVFRTSGAPIRPQSLQIVATDVDGNVYSVTADENGDLTDPGLTGTVDYENGLVFVRFTDGVDPIYVFASQGRYNAVMLTYLPLDAELIGLDPVRLPSDGRVPVFRAGDVVVVHHEQSTEVTTPTPAASVDVGRVRLSEVRITDSSGASVAGDQYTADLDAGIVTLAGSLDTVTHPAPWTVVDRVEDMALVSSVEISGEISLTRALSHDYPVGSKISGAMVFGDLQARVTNLFDQSTWTSEFSDELIGTEPTSEYDDANYPIAVSNRGAISQRWAIVFTGSTQFRVVGESIGDLGNGSTTVETAPINPNTGEPYFTIPANGWGGGWSAGNVLRFNTIGASFPVWIVRAVTQSEPAGDSDSFRIQIRGNINA